MASEEAFQQSIFDSRPMSSRQWLAVATTVVLNALDGFDVVSISLAAPGIARDWSLGPVALGAVLSMELVGMIAGSILLANLADRFGRRPLILACVSILAVGMLLTALATNLTQLAALRVMTGLGIGGMVATVTTAAAEFANRQWRGLCVSVTVVGYSLGIVVGGLVSAYLLATHGWASVFVLGGVAALAVLPLVILTLPESPAFHVAQRGPEALLRVNDVLARMRHARITELPVANGSPPGSYRALFAPGMAAVTLVATAGYMAHISTFYFITKWMPTLIVGLGHTPADAAFYVVQANVGGVLAGIGFGLLARTADSRRLSALVLLGSFLAVGVFGALGSRPHTLKLAVILVGIFANAGVAGLYTVLTAAFPGHLRATGTGFVVGLGRGAAFVAPILAGWLIASGLTVTALTAVMAAGSLLGAGLVTVLPRPPRRA